jgi:hypothetical protein
MQNVVILILLFQGYVNTVMPLYMLSQCPRFRLSTVYLDLNKLENERNKWFKSFKMPAKREGP